ncbi:tyrosine-type recombinase/integrase [Piscibacillus sp. B03]|uniref:tyrosine-type recombinase/integrase n=1 Tax=Piscibacillus sp. B03 TaxID=3457430 RepID=UPI003FCDB763
MPIDNKLAQQIKLIIYDKDKSQSMPSTSYLFVRNQGPRVGRPFGQSFVRLKLKEFVRRNQILDESGQLFNLKPHQFRHTYAVKMLNGGAGLVTVQDLLGHAYPDMTLRYAKLLDHTKRKVFDSVINQGVFELD